VEGARGIEIGSFEGRSAIWFLRNVLTGKDARMCCIDTFDMAFQGAPLVGTSEELHDRFERNLRAYGLRDRVDKLAGKSQELLRTLPLDTYDFAYIDGSHRTDEVLEDTVLVWRLVRIGGVVIFDDYGMSAADDPLIRPGTAIDAFIAMNPARVEVLHRGVQLAVRRLA
jgi:predicted O-methyltransferase YrrM